MTYTKKQFGDELAKQIELNYDVKKLSHWAYGIYLQYCDQFETGLYTIVMDVVTMAEGYEFEILKEELIAITEDLKTN
jgi:hypothetical protein